MRILLCILFVLKVCHCYRDDVSYVEPLRIYEQSLKGYQIDFDIAALRKKPTFLQRIEPKPQSTQKPHRELIYPCARHDIRCIQQYLTKSHICTYSFYQPQQNVIKSLKMDIPQANATFTINNATVEGLSDWEVKEFYISTRKSKETLVLELEFDQVKVNSSKSEIAYYRKGREPIVVSDNSSIVFNSLSLTLTAKNINKMQEGHSRFHVQAYLPGAMMPTLGRGLLRNYDYFEIEGRRALLSRLNLTMQEAFINQGPVFMSLALQSLCSYVHY